MEMTGSKLKRTKARSTSILEMDVRMLLAVLALFSIPFAPALFGLRIGGIVQGVFGLLIFLMSQNSKSNNLVLIYLVFIGWLALGTLYSIDASSSLFILLGSGLLTSLAVSNLLAEQFESPRAQLSFYANVFTWATILACFYCIAVEGLTTRLGREVYANGGTYIYLSLNILVSGLLVLWKIIYQKEVDDKPPIVWMQMALVVLFCMLSATRKVILGLAACALLLIAYKNKVKPIKLLILLLIMTGLFVGLVYLVMTVPELRETVGLRFQTMLASLLNEGLDESMAERGHLRELAFSLFSQNKLFGVGTESFREYSAMAFGRYRYSHCNYTELLCNNGIIGFLLYYSIYVLVVIEAFRHKDYPIRAFTLCSCITLVALDYSQVSYYQIPYIMFFFVLYSINRGCRNRLVREDGS